MGRKKKNKKAKAIKKKKEKIFVNKAKTQSAYKTNMFKSSETKIKIKTKLLKGPKIINENS